MKTTTEYMREALNNLRESKAQNFGSLPDNFKALIEEIGTEPGPVMLMMASIMSAVSESGKLKEALSRATGVSLQPISDDGEVEKGLVKIDGSQMDWLKLVRSSWDFFEPAFLMLYLGIQTGRAMAEDEQSALKSIARAERMKANPNAFDSTLPAPSSAVLSRAVLSRPVSDSPDLPAITPAQAEKFRKELERELAEENSPDAE